MTDDEPRYLRWTRIDPSGSGLHAPKRDGDCGWDLEAAEAVTLKPGSQVDVSTNVRVSLPPGTWGEVRARSSIARKGLQADSGVIDEGYTGELLVLLRNMNGHATHVGKGERIAQLVIHLRPSLVVPQEVSELPHDPRRGPAGFGSTGV